MLKDEAVHHFIQKGNILEKTKLKVPYGHGRGQVSEETEVRKEYTPQVGKPSEQLKTPDSLNFGENRFLDTAYNKQYKTTKEDSLAIKDFHKTRELKTEIKVHSKNGNVFQSKEEHSKKYKTDEIVGENNAKPDSWIRGKNEKKNLEFKDKTTHVQSYPGHDGNHAEKQNERYDNLKQPTNVPIKDRTAYKEAHGGKSPDIKADKELFNHNHQKGKNGHKFLENPDNKKETAYGNHFNETLKVDGIQEKPHFGKDDQAKDFLYQYHGGYYHAEK